MRKQTYGTFVIAVAALWVGLSGCASKHARVADKVTSDELQQSFAQMRDRIEKGRSEDLPVLSPEAFHSSLEKLDQAEKMRTAGRSNEDIVVVLQQGTESLNKAEANASVIRAAVPDVLQARAQAIQSGMPKARPERFRGAEADLIRMSQAVEHGRLDAAQNSRVDLVKGYQTVEAETLKEETLAAARANLDRAKKLGASRLAPSTLKQAEDSFQVAEKRIENRLQVDEPTQKAVEKALFDSRRLLNITEWAKYARETGSETVALQVESMLKKISDEVAAGDLRDHSFETQVQAMTAHIENLKGTNQANFASLRSEAEASRFYEHLAGKFTDEEAEVVREGDAVVIRLKSLAFPIGKASLGEQDFALLGKVTEALSGMKAVDVTVQGHADSTGSEDFNRKLSAKRAETVRQYLISSNAVPAGHVQVDAKGSVRPVRTNATTKGRAQNRRVDVIIRSVTPARPMAE